MQQIISRIQIRFYGLQVFQAILFLHEYGSAGVQLFFQLLEVLSRLFSLCLYVIAVIYPEKCRILLLEYN